MPPTLANGKICYLELPSTDPKVSAAFYGNVFGWAMRTRGDGAVAFDDTVGQVSGAFVTKRSAWAGVPGLLVYIWVTDIVDACRRVEAYGGAIVQAVGADAPELTARFRDPAGNVLGLYQEPVTGR